MSVLLNILGRDRILLVYRILINLLLLTIWRVLPSWRERLSFIVRLRLVIILGHCISLLIWRLIYHLSLISLRINVTRLILKLLSLWPVSMVILTRQSWCCSLNIRILRLEYICTLRSSWLLHIYWRDWYLITRLHSWLSPVWYITGLNVLLESRRRSLSMQMRPHARCRHSLSANWLLRHFAIRVILILPHMLYLIWS